MSTREYEISVDRDRATVSAWAAGLLPFQIADSRAWCRDFRRDLRDEISRVTPLPGAMIAAALATTETIDHDAENVLLYNVGLDVFHGRWPRGIRFERLTSTPRPPDDLLTTYYRYELAAEPMVWSGREFATWKGIALMPQARPSVTSTWLSLRRSEDDVRLSGEARDAPFALRLHLEAPVGASPVSLLKPVVDGTISAFHGHSGPDDPTVVTRLAVTTGVAPSEIATLLCSGSMTALGARRLVWRFRSGVQWNPADDRCAAAELSVSRGARWTLSGSLLDVSVRF